MTAVALLASASGEPGEISGGRFHPGDDILLAQLRSGEERAIETLFRRLADPLAAFARRLGVDAADAEQVVLDVFHDIWQRRETLASDIRVEPYFFRAVRNRALDRVRADGRRAKYEAEGGAFLSLVPASIVETAVADDDPVDKMLIAVRSAIAALPESQRTALYFRYTRELPLSDVADAMELTLGAVKMLLQRAIRTLRERVGGVFEQL